MNRKVAITTSTFGKYDTKPFSLLEESGFEVITNNFGRKLKEEETLDLCGRCIGVIAGTEIYNSYILEKLNGLKVISRCGVGMESVDTETACRLGIKVFNTPNGPTLAVAELTIGLILNLLRKVGQMDADIRSGKWDKLMGNLLFGKKVGIIGFGRIGQKVGQLLSGFGIELAYCDKEEKKHSYKCRGMGMIEILKWADIITLHLSVSKGEGPVIGKKELEVMKNGSWLVNVSRGGVVDEDALYEALKAGRLSGAALDVFEKEPYEGRLKELDNVILTPHIGSYAKEARVRMEIEAVKNLLTGLGR